ncbi:MAG: NAD(P)H-binding protein [Chloroflexota bacterium]
MAKVVILGAAGSLGKHVAEQALIAGHDVTVIVRNAAKLPAAWREQVHVYEADLAQLSTTQLGSVLTGYDALVNTAGVVSDGDMFVALIDHIVTSVEGIPPSLRPRAWFLAGAGLLDIADTGYQGLDLALLKKTYWPHAVNFKRLNNSSLDWCLLCPGPMVEGAAIGLDKLRVSLDRLPVQMPAWGKWLPPAFLMPFFAYRVAEMIVPYADAAALMVNNLVPNSPMVRHRVGLALPPGMRGKK